MGGLVTELLRRAYRWCVDVLGQRTSPVFLAGVAFTEAIFFPIPPEVLLIPMCIARHRRAIFYAFLTTVFSVAGAWVGYVIGRSFMESVGVKILDAFHMHQEFEIFRSLYGEYGLYIVFLAAFTPLPYKVFSISSGALHLSLPVFLIASFTGRGLRYILIALPFQVWGKKAEEFIERHLEKITLAGGILITAIMVIWHFFVRR